MFKNRRSALTAVVALFIAPGLSTIAFAQSAPELTSSSPIYLKQGESTEISLAGNKLGGATKVFLTDPRGLQGELAATDKAKPNEVKLKLTSSAEAELGVRELRIATPTGVTAPVSVTVGQFNPTADVEPNNSTNEAQKIAFPTSIVGQLQAGGDLDDYRFEAKKSQTLIFDLHASRIGSALEPVVAILDSTGREMPRKISLRQVSATSAADPVVIFEVPADGTYTLHVRDMQYRGGGAYSYRIDAGEIPFVESILPASARRGTKVDVQAIGYNLGKHAQQSVDTSAVSSAPADAEEADASEIPIRFRTPAGLSNEVSLAIAEASPLAEKTPNNTAGNAMPVSLPAEVSGVLAQAGEEDFYRFTVSTKQPITIEAVARRDGSPVDVLLTLRDIKGQTLDQNNGAGESEARLSRSFEPGDYIVSVRDLTFAGGSSHSYRLNFVQAAGIPPDFAVRFMPDAPRVSRGGSTKVWCEVVRLNGYPGDIGVTIDGLPKGVRLSGGPVLIGEKTSGLFTLTASEDAALGVVPIRLRAVGTAGTQQAVRYGQAEENGRSIAGAYLAVLEAAPIAVATPAQPTPQQMAAYPAEVQKLAVRINAPSPEIDKAQAEWEAKFAGGQQWQTIDVTHTESAGGAELKKQPDGSLLQTGKSPLTDTYTIIGSANLKQIAAVRLEVMPDASLPSNGPGRSAGGNFVVHTFAASIAARNDPKNTKPINFTSAKATFEQDGYGVFGAANNNLNDGWAISGGTGQAQAAWFFPDEPIPAGDVIVTVNIIQQYGESHTLGRFRLSLSDDPKVKAEQTESAPPAIAAALKIPADKRSPEQKAQIATYYRSIAPALQADRAKLEALRTTVGPLAEVSRLEAVLASAGAGLDRQRKEWEQTVAAGFAWTPVEVSSAKGTAGTVLTREKDDSLVASGPVPPNDVYQITGKTSLRAISAIRLEALPDERFANNGPGQNQGNFVLTKFGVSVPGAKPGEATPIMLRDPRATFEQANFPIEGTLDDNPDTGWAISPMPGAAHTATFFPRTPVVTTGDGQLLNFSLEFGSSKHKAYTLGRFRLWVLGATNESMATKVPGSVLDILKLPEEKRTPAQKEEVASFYRSIAPSLEPTRQRLAELRAKLPQYPMTIVRNKGGSIAVPITRANGTTGAVKVTLEGFSAGRDPATRMPTPITKNFDITPLAIAPEASFGRLAIKAKANAEVGTRMVVIKAETTVGKETFVQYSEAFPITVLEK